MKVLLTDMRHSSAGEERKVFEPFGIEIDTTFCRTEEDLIRNGRGAAGFLVSYAQVTRRVMESLPDLKVIVKYGVGVDNIDIPAAHELGRHVANVPDYCVEEVALQAMTLSLSGLRMSHAFGAQVRTGNWVEDLTAAFLHRISGSTLGLIGYGRIARRLELYMRPMVARVLAYDPFQARPDADRALNAELVDSIDGLFEECGVISIHAPLTSQTRGMVGARALAHSRGAILINTSRAAIVNKEDLASALDAGRISFYGADTFWQEPADYADPWTSGFLSRKNVLVTPHMGWYSVESEAELRRKAAQEVLRVIQGERPLHEL